jgi:hypothetical protein
VRREDMSNANVQTRVTAPDPGVPSRTLTYYGQIAVQLSALLAAFAVAVPDFQVADAPDKRFLERKRRVPKAFIGTASARPLPQRI